MKQYFQIIQRGIGPFLNWFANFGRNKNVAIFFVFLTLSTGFWFLNALRRSYTTTISYPIRFGNIPKGSQSDSLAPVSVSLKVKASGYTLLRFQLSDYFKTTGFEAKLSTRIRNDENKGIYILTRDYMTQISNHVTNEIELLEISPDTLFLGMFQRQSKQVPVRFSGNLLYQQQFNQTGPITIEPDSVMISGTVGTLDTINAVYTLSQDFNNLNDTLQKILSVQLIDNVAIAKRNVKVTVPVESFTESSVDVPLIIRGVPDSLVLKTFPSEIKVSFRVGLSRFEKIQSRHFEAYVDVNGLNLSEQQQLKVKLEKIPDFIYSIDYSPLFVDFILERNK
jgi:hypothetical protein